MAQRPRLGGLVDELQPGTGLGRAPQVTSGEPTHQQERDQHRPSYASATIRDRNGSEGLYAVTPCRQSCRQCLNGIHRHDSQGLCHQDEKDDQSGNGSSGARAPNTRMQPESEEQSRGCGCDPNRATDERKTGWVRQTMIESKPKKDRRCGGTELCYQQIQQRARCQPVEPTSPPAVRVDLGELPLERCGIAQTIAGNENRFRVRKPRLLKM